MLRKILLTLVLYVGVAVSALAGDVVVIVNGANAQSLSKVDIKNIYSDLVTNWDNGSGIHSFHLPVKDGAREEFSQTVLGKSSKETAMDWANKKITNTAKNPPRTKKSRLVVSLVAKDKDAIGYAERSVAEGKKGIRIIEIE